MPEVLPGKIILPPKAGGGLTVQAVLFLLAILAKLISSSLGPPQPPKKSQLEHDPGEDDNKRVVKMRDVSETIDSFITYQRFGIIFIKGLITTIKSAFEGGESLETAEGIEGIHELETKLDNEIIGPLREELKEKIRDLILQQTNRRKEKTLAYNQRQGFLHRGSPAGRHHPGDDPFSGGGPIGA